MTERPSGHAQRTASDALRKAAPRIVAHMNDDHADALVAYCRAFAGLPATESATMVGLDRDGMDLLATMRGGEQHTARVAFPSPVDSAEDVRAAAIALLRQARTPPSAS